MSCQPDYEKATNAAYDVLARLHSYSIVTDVFCISGELLPRCRLLTYSQASQLYHFNFDSLTAESEYGLTFIQGRKRIILYNEGLPLCCIRFTIAHELGHTILEHRLEDDPGEEREANCFARNLLCPCPVARQLNLNCPNQYSGIFNVSNQMAAAAIKAKIKEARKKPREVTLGEAINRYIESKDVVLSPSTVAGYRRIRKNDFTELMSIKLSDLTQERVQRAVNKMARSRSAKTVKNAYGLLTATLAEFYPSMILRTTLPQKQRVDIIVPSEEDIKKILEAVHGTTAELPVLLAVWLGLRMSEIRGLTWDSIEGDMLHIKQALVDEGLKGTKTYGSNRRIPLPREIKDLIEQQPHKGDFIIPCSRRAIASRFNYYCEKAGIQHYRFHDLRHVNASVMLALGVPDKYAMARMGHATNNMLKTVYQHTMPEEEIKTADKVNQYFSNLVKKVPGE